MILRVRRLHDRAILPTRHNARDAGLDLFAVDDVAVRPGEILKVPTGIAVQPAIVVDGAQAAACLVWDKSGRAAAGLKTMGGVIDESYTGELLVVVTNLNTATVFEALAGGDPAEVRRAIDQATVRIPYGKALAQLLVQTVDLAGLAEVEELDATIRGEKGFGSSDPDQG